MAPKFVNPPESDVERILDEARTLNAMYADASTPQQWRGPFQAPVRVPANSSFGSRSVFNGALLRSDC